MAAKRPTILQIIPELDTGGAELSTIEIAEAIERAGGRAIVLSEGGRLVQRLRDTGAELQFFPAAAKNPVRLWWNGRRIAEVVRRDGVDLIHARSRAPAWSAMMAARRTGLPFVTTYHGAYNERSPLKRLYNGVMARGDVVIANSQYTADLIRMRYGTPLDRLRVIYRGVDDRWFDPAKVAAQRVTALRKEWGVKPGARVILNAARLTRWKGQNVLIEAVRLLREGGRLGSGVLVLAGDAQGRGGYQRQLEQEVQKGGVAEQVRIVGHVDDMAGGVLGGARRCRRLDRAGGVRTHGGGGADDGHARNRDRHRRAAGDGAECEPRRRRRGDGVARAAQRCGAAGGGACRGAHAHARGANRHGRPRAFARGAVVLAGRHEAADA